jgi:hypothetical protein
MPETTSTTTTTKPAKSTNKFCGKYRTASTRLKTWDYASNGYYFITICTKNRHNYFGDIIDENIKLNQWGEIANKYWLEIPDHFDNVKIDAFIVMPNHIHGIIILENANINSCRNIDNANVNDNVNDNANVETRQCLVSTTKPGILFRIRDDLLFCQCGQPSYNTQVH